MEYNELCRNIRISLLFLNLNIDPERFKYFKKSKAYKDYLKYGNNYPITGSWSLFIFGLIDRTPKDLDLVVDYIPSNLNTHKEEGYPIIHGLNSLGFKKLGNTIFDYFMSDIADTIEYDNVKISKPIQTILAKRNIIKESKVTYSQSKKHIQDLVKINISLEKLINRIDVQSLEKY